MTRAFLFVLVASCSGGPAPKPPLQLAHPDATCDERACMEAFEGKDIAVLGTFVFPTDPTRKGSHLYKLVLVDDTTVILPHPSTDALRATLSRENDGKPMTVRGVYYKQPPERYGIIQATADPYLVEMREASLR